MAKKYEKNFISLFQTIFESKAVLIYPILKAGKEEMLGATSEEMVLIAQTTGVLQDILD